MTSTPPLRSALEVAPPLVAALYTDAERACALLPGHALVQIRAALAALVDAWLGQLHRGTSCSLAEQTGRLVGVLALSEPTAAVFREIRVAGNLGAHPEQRPGRPPTRTEARDALYKLYGLIGLYAEAVAGTDRRRLAAFVEPPAVHWGDVCERAVFQDDPSAMIAIGRRFREQALSGRDEAERRARHEGEGSWQLDLSPFNAALRWFEQALEHESNPDALFERANLLLFDLPLDEKTDEAIQQLRWAAEAGQADAQYKLAVLLLEERGPNLVPRDPAEARGWAERAAEAEHPGALNLLTMIFGNGIGVEVDHATAVAYARRASEAGYPLAHANLALLLLPDARIDAVGREILALIERAKVGGAGPAWWVEYLLLESRGEIDRAEGALRTAADMEVFSALILISARLLRADPATWDVFAIGALLIRALNQDENAGDRTEALQHIRRIRDEGARRLRAGPGALPRPEDYDNLFGMVLQAGVWLIFGPGEQAWPMMGEVLDALVRVQGGSPSQGPATQDDVSLILSVMPTFPVRWTATGPLMFHPAADSGHAPRPGAPSNPSKVIRRIARNGPCTCGSGRNYKGCCGRGAAR
ncbi:MAG: DUF4145 domain-containing protein [Myxococcota bacterium]